MTSRDKVVVGDLVTKAFGQLDQGALGIVTEVITNSKAVTIVCVATNNGPKKWVLGLVDKISSVASGSA